MKILADTDMFLLLENGNDKGKYRVVFEVSHTLALFILSMMSLHLKSSR